MNIFLHLSNILEISKAQQSQLREFQQTTNLVLERIDTQQTEIRHIWEYLRHRNGGSSPPAD